MTARRTVHRSCRNVRFDPNFSVIDESEGWIVVDKPAPLQVHPSVPGSPPTLLDGLAALLAYEVANGAVLSIINRLDRETSGVVVVAKSRDAARFLHTAMQERRVEKRYAAVVWGWPEQDTFEVDAPIRRQGEFADSPVWVKRAIHPDGAPARTRFRILRRIDRASPRESRFALVEAAPETGRMHQIRIHLAEAGCPVVGDKIYGPQGESAYLQFIEHGWSADLERQLLLPRHALHCQQMSIPGAGSWTAPLPRDIRMFLAAA